MAHHALTQSVFFPAIVDQIVVQYVANFAAPGKLTKETTVQPMYHCRGFHKGHLSRERNPTVDTRTGRQIINAVAAARRAIEDYAKFPVGHNVSNCSAVSRRGRLVLARPSISQ
jgi:hypothetical protein